jgi:hypothetical protein
VIIIVFFIFIGVAGILYERKKERDKIKDSNRPLIDTKARIKAKYRSVDRSTGEIGRSTAMRFFVTFSQENGESVTLKVPYFKYMKLKEGSSGNLKYKEASFIDFVAD